MTLATLATGWVGAVEGRRRGGGGAVVDVPFLLLITSCRKNVLPIVGRVPDVEMGSLGKVGVCSEDAGLTA